MNKHESILSVRFDGTGVGAGRIPVSHLLRFLSNFNKVLHRTGRVLQGDTESLRRGQPPQRIASEVELELVSLTHGSPAAVLSFDRVQQHLNFPEMDFGLQILESAIGGLETVQRKNANYTFPEGYDTGVLMAWRDLGKLFGHGIEKIEFTLSHSQKPVQASLTPEGVAHIKDRIKGPQVNIRVIEGRLLMADFKEDGTRFRVHPSTGDPVLCLFDEEQKDEVLENILQYVRVVGEAREDPVSRKIAEINIHDIERLDELQNEATDLLPRGTPISQSFWNSPTFQELARTQNVQPMADVRVLFGTWPDDEDDGFEASIDELRHRRAETGPWS